MTEEACGKKQKIPRALTIPGMWAKMIAATSLDHDAQPSACRLSNRGPVAQLGARFHGMEEVAGSIPARSTNSLYCEMLQAWGSKPLASDGTLVQNRHR